MKVVVPTLLFLGLLVTVSGSADIVSNSETKKEEFKSFWEPLARFLSSGLTPQATEEAIVTRGHRQGPFEHNVTNIFERPTTDAPSVMSATPVSAAPFSSAPVSIAPFSSTPVSVTPFSTTPVSTSLSPVSTSLSPVGTSPAPFDGGGETSGAPVSSPAVIAPSPSGTTGAPTPGANLTVLTFLESTLTDDGTITQPGTPQNKAYMQLQANNPDLNPNDPADQVDITQIYVLNTFYYSLNLNVLEKWTMEELWTTAAPICGSGNTNWYGVSCDSTGIVTGLNLTSNNMNGTLPSELQGLTALSKYFMYT